RLKPANGEIEDICVMWNTVSGISEDKDVQIDYYMWEKADGSNSAMARVTAFPAAIAAVMVGKGLIPQVGIIPPEDAIVGPVYEEFMLELQKRDIKILEVISSIA
ncbi:MAG: saccharopine dehydrogenase, partial [Anaerolineae bacterium]|nr:saccharopine dehydrogenase [Anaerolineae bacterium]